jgi:hypothetical protein
MSDDDTFVLCDNDIAGEIAARITKPWFASIRDDEREWLIANGFGITLHCAIHRELMELLKFAGRKAETQLSN